jgi:hypothetical protein
VHHDTASARSWVQLRVRVVACTAVDDPPPKQDDGPARGAVGAFGRFCDDGLQRAPLLLWRHRSSRRRLRRPNYPLRCAEGGQVFRRAASTPRRSAQPSRRRRQTRFAGQSPPALVLPASALIEQLVDLKAPRLTVLLAGSTSAPRRAAAGRHRWFRAHAQHEA